MIQSSQTLSRYFSAFNQKKVIVLGDVMVDAYMWGKVERISPEAPVPIVAVKRKDYRLGGAANVAMNIRELGATPLLFSVIGTDVEGDILLDMLEQSGISTNFVKRSDARPTTVKTRVISGHQHMLRIDHEITETLAQQDLVALLQLFEEHIAEADIVVLEDYDKGVLDKNLIEGVIAAAKKRGKKIIVDPKKKNFLHYRGVDVMKPNLKELREGLKLDLPKTFSIASVQQAAQKLRDELDLQTALITLSENGIYIGSDDEEHHIPAHIRDIYDVSGAGDTVIAIAAIMLACGAPIRLAAEVANLGGGLVCEKIGVVPVDKQKLLNEALHKLKLEK